MTREYGTGSYRKLRSGKYQLRWSDGIDPFTGKRITRSETVAAKNVTEVRQMLADRTGVRRATSRITLGELLTTALPLLDVTDATRDRYRYALAHVPTIARNWVAVDMTPRDARLIIEGLTERGHGAATVRKCQAAIMSCWKQGYLEGWVPADSPFAKQRLPRVNRSAGVPLTSDQVTRLLAACTGNLETAWIRIHLATGARPGEVVALRWSSFDHADRTVVFVDQKHHGRERRVAVDDTTLSHVTSWQAEQVELADGHGGLIDDPFIITKELDGSEPWRRDYASRFRWYKIRDRAELPDGLRLYELRHTHNSMLNAAGIDSATRGQRIGNSRDVNEGIYTHALRDRDAAAAVEKMLP